MAGIAINGKFMGANLNGVHRMAALHSRELIRRGEADHTVRLLTPPGVRGDPDFPSLVGQTVAGKFGRGQGWEMLTLPRAAQNALLVNFCNLAPLLHGNSVVMIHDAQTFLFPDDYTGRQATFYRLLLPLIARRARRILTVSAFSRESLVAHGVGTADKIDVVHNGTDHILDQPADKGILDRHGLRAGEYVLTLGSAKGYKNMRAVFSAMEQPVANSAAPNPASGAMPLVVAGGPGANAYIAAGWRPPTGTFFTGFVSDAELRALYEGAAVFAFPSLTEGFGLPPVEAMHCGCPVVAARAGAMPEVLADAAILVDADQPDQYRLAIKQVLENPDVAAKLRAKGAERAAQLTWEIAGDRLWSLLRPLL